MSRTGKNPIPLPPKAKVSFEGRTVKVEGPLGAHTYTLPEGFSASVDNNNLVVERESNEGKHKVFSGHIRSLLANMVEGVTKGFEKRLDIVGIGYKAEVDKNRLTLHLGFSRPVIYGVPPGIKVEVEKLTKIIVKGSDKQLVGNTAATIRGLKKPDAYKGKGIRYEGEVVKIKPGKTVAK